MKTSFSSPFQTPKKLCSYILNTVSLVLYFFWFLSEENKVLHSKLHSRHQKYMCSRLSGSDGNPPLPVFPLIQHQREWIILLQLDPYFSNPLQTGFARACCSENKSRLTITWNRTKVEFAVRSSKSCCCFPPAHILSYAHRFQLQTSACHGFVSPLYITVFNP